jgi:hypothetical protein
MGTIGSGFKNLGNGTMNAGSGLVHGIAGAGRAGTDAVGVSNYN